MRLSFNIAGHRVGVTVKIEGATQAGQWFGAMAQRLRSPRPLWLIIASILRARFRENFRNAGPGWTPLALSTIAAKRFGGMPDPADPTKKPRRLSQWKSGSLVFDASNILIENGFMRDALCRRGAKGNITRIDDDGLFVGISDDVVPYAKYHEYGGTSAYPIVPRRALYLKFMGHDGQHVYRKGVMHPPLPARPMTTIGEEEINASAAAAMAYLLGEPGSRESD